MPPDVLDVRQVVCWYQSGWPHVSRMRNVLIPELLVKDASLFKVDSARRINVLGFDGYPEDRDTLQPFGIRPFDSLYSAFQSCFSTGVFIVNWNKYVLSPALITVGSTIASTPSSEAICDNVLSASL